MGSLMFEHASPCLSLHHLAFDNFPHRFNHHHHKVEWKSGTPKRSIRTNGLCICWTQRDFLFCSTLDGVFSKKKNYTKS